ncbi:MAG: ABC transporter permease [Elusimicrobia bacterium]|nr:ABC transporter permease [Elusimicrobiota bacterium]
MSRILTVVRRYVLIHLKSPARLLDLFFWPVMELFVWGFFTMYLRRTNLDANGRLMITLINALVFWDILYRSQQALSLAFMEELWTRNVLNLLISPLRTREWVIGAYIYGLIKTGIIVVILLVLAALFYAFNVTALGFYFIPIAANLLLFGYAMGLFTTGLLLRWGHSAEALIWGVPFLIQPFSAIFYPVSVYPAWLKPVVLALPSTHVLEAMRTVIDTGLFPWTSFWAALGLNVLFTLFFSWFCLRMLERGRANGQLVRMSG